MTLKKYQKIKLIITVLLAVIFSQSIIYKNYLIPLATLVIAFLGLILLRRQVKEVVADERDFAITGKSASWAIQIYSWVSVVVMFILYTFRDLNPIYESIAMTLAYSTCFLMIIYGLIFRFRSNSKNEN